MCGFNLLIEIFLRRAKFGFAFRQKVDFLRRRGMAATIDSVASTTAAGLLGWM